jgi:hypothetical protein
MCGYLLFLRVCARRERLENNINYMSVENVHKTSEGVRSF